MASSKILLIDDHYGLSQAPLPPTRFLQAFLSERGHTLLNMDLYLNPSQATIFEKTLHLLKQSTLSVFIINEESVFLGFVLQQALQRQQRCLFFSQNTSLLNKIQGITFKPLYPVLYTTQQDIVSSLKLNRL